MSEQTTNNGKMGPWTAGILALAAVLSFGLATLLEFWRGDTTAQAVEEVSSERYDRLAQMEEGMAKEVNSYRWVKKAEGVVQLPIDVAMKATLKELQGSQSQPRPSGVPVDPAAVLATPTDKGAEEPTEPEAADEKETADEAGVPEEQPGEAGDAPAPAPEVDTEEAQA